MMMKRQEVKADIRIDSAAKCEICKEKQHKYKCPGRDTLYCSVECFQKHNLGECNEGFAKDQVEQELRN